MLFKRQILVRAAVAAGVIAFGSIGSASESGIGGMSVSGAGEGTAPSITVSQYGGTGSSASGKSGSAAGSEKTGSMVYTATLSPSEEVPPAANSKGQGTAEVSVDPATNEMTYTVSYSGLTGPATMAHIHGPASPGSNAGVVVPFKEVTGGTEKASGKAKLTQAQASDLAAGKYYVNVHTSKYPNGEIRGQLKKQ